MGRARKTESEKKEKQRERSRRFKAKHVNLGDQIERWAMIKCLTEADSDRMVAKLLIDFFLENNTDLKLRPVTETTQSGTCTGQTGFHLFDTEEAIGLGSFGTKTDICEIKVEVTPGDIAIDNTKTTQRDQTEFHFDTAEVKTEVNDDYITEDTDVGETAADNTETTQTDKTELNIDAIEIKTDVNDDYITEDTDVGETAADNTDTTQTDKTEMNIDTVEIKTEVNDYYITEHTDVGETAADNTETTQTDKTEMNINTVEVKIEVNDEETTLPYATGLDTTEVKCDELIDSGSSKNKLFYRGNSLEENNGSGTSKRKRISDSISKLKQKMLKEVQ